MWSGSQLITSHTKHCMVNYICVATGASSDQWASHQHGVSKICVCARFADTGFCEAWSTDNGREAVRLCNDVNTFSAPCWMIMSIFYFPYFISTVYSYFFIYCFLYSVFFFLWTREKPVQILLYLHMVNKVYSDSDDFSYFKIILSHLMGFMVSIIF